MMRPIHITDKEPFDFKGWLSMEKGSRLLIIQGSSKDITFQIQLFLQNMALHGNALRYFLCSSSEQFSVPFYQPFGDHEVASEPINPRHLFNRPLSSREIAIRKLEKDITEGENVPRYIVIEYITAPKQHEQMFESQLLRLSILQHIPVLIFVHQIDYCEDYPLVDSEVDELLALLYLCGGRVRESDWPKTVVHLPVQCSSNNRLLASRWVGSETWICYAHREAAKLAENIYCAMSRERRQKLAQRVLQSLPSNTGYPLLAIANETEELEAMQSKYSQEALTATLAEPLIVIKYFDRLYQLAQKADRDSLVGVVYTCYLTALMHENWDHVLRVYQMLQGVPLRALDQSVEASFWVFLGGSLALTKLSQAWLCAADCLLLGRKITNHLYSIDKIQRDEWRFSLAIIANTEALIAYKLGQGEEARQLEEFVVTELSDLPTSVIFLSHVRTNFGDLFLRLFGDVDSAIMQYEAALMTPLRLSRKLRRRLGLPEVTQNELRAAQKLGDALLLVGRYEEAFRAFDALLSRVSQASNLSSEEIAERKLKARLALVEVCLKMGRPRSAAACYWHILRQSAWLKSEALKDAEAKLRELRPNLHERLHRHIDGIIAAQEEIEMDVLNVQQILSDLRKESFTGSR